MRFSVARTFTDIARSLPLSLSTALAISSVFLVTYPSAAQQVSAVGVSEVVLRNGQWTWIEDAALQPTGGPAARAAGVTLLISIPGQVAYVYRDGVLIAASTVSTGKPGKRTPTGEFPILQKRVHHRSNIYSNAPMPFMQRLTWDGIALHAGHLPGHPASHGCIRFPHAFAERLYGVTVLGTPVTVVDYEIVDPRVRRGAPALAPEIVAQQMASAPRNGSGGRRRGTPYVPADFSAFKTGDYDQVTMTQAVAAPDVAGTVSAPMEPVKRRGRRR